MVINTSNILHSINSIGKVNIINHMIYRKAITYENFMALPEAERKEHSNYFHSNFPEHCPVIINVKHAGKQVSLKMCKYAISELGS